MQGDMVVFGRGRATGMPILDMIRNTQNKLGSDKLVEVRNSHHSTASTGS